MTTADSRRAVRTLMIVAATTAASLIAVAAPAGAQPASSSSPGPCARAAKQWARLVTANDAAKAAFDRAQALQNRVIRTGRVAVAHRLDARLAHLRAVHAHLVIRAHAIAARVQGRCSDRPPTLSDF